MVKLGPYEVHPFADDFPLIEGEEFDELVQDVKRNGLRQPIILSHDRAVLIDGRNRYRACDAAAVEPTFKLLGSEYTEPEILDLIISLNINRRQLEKGQRAMIGLRYEAAYAEAVRAAEAARKLAAPSNQYTAKSSATSADLQESRYQRESAAHAARVVGVSPRAIYQAKAVQLQAPDLADQVRAGAMALDAADRERRERGRHLPKPEPVKAGPVMLTLRTHTGDPVPYPKPQGKPTFNASPGEGISWASWSWNPVTGCLHGCDYCYARELASSERLRAAYPVGFTPLYHPERLEAPANTAIPEQYRGDPAWRRVFVCSMADLYGRWVPDEWVDAVHASMCANPRWQYITLTKFPSRYVGLEMPPGAWVGTSVDEQRRVRIAEDAFRKIDGVAVKWLSLEPLLEPLEFADLSMFDWVVIGAQTETRQPDRVVPAFAPPFDWVARIYAQAREAGCKVHMKPNLLGRVSGQLPGMQLPDEYPNEGARA